MLGLSWETVRLFLHVLAATIWVGGQLTLAALVPTLRALGADIPRAAARRFALVAWPAFGVLIATGVWNIIAESDKNHGSWKVTLNVKMALVVVSGVTAYFHSTATSKKAIAISGALTGLTAVIVLLMGIQLAG